MHMIPLRVGLYYLCYRLMQITLLLVICGTWQAQSTIQHVLRP